MEERYMELG